MRYFKCHCEERQRQSNLGRQARFLDCFAALAMTMLCVLPAYANDLPPECRLLPAHVPRADVSAEYQAGVDVRGKPVVPADINGGYFNDLERVVIPLSVDLAERLKNSNIEGLQLEADLGTLEIYQSGRVSYNGQDWTSQVYAICGETIQASEQSVEESIETDAVEVEPVNAVPPSGQ